jgi:lysophospholipase L1-like esterase
MDVSGSMSESVPASNGSGSVVKLEAAKQALQEPIQNQPPGARVGIWTFPGGTGGGCSVGSWLVSVHSSTSPAAILNSITGLRADGGTPTGPALQALVEDLQAHGIDNANILVVSDGLYGCGPDPCEVAKDLVGTGFNLAIQAVGFDISETGRESLTCMAEATGGNYFDASDSAELNDVIAELTTPQFVLKLTGTDRPIAGKPTTITATLTNTSVFDAHDVKLRLAFGTSQPGLLQPQVIPATIGVGMLPAGQTATRSWRFVAGEPGVHGKAVYSVSASSLETMPVQAGGSFSTVVPGNEAKDAGDILSGLIENKQSLAILGDSFSSGEGAYQYLPASPGASEKCHRSPDTYLARTFTAAKVRVEILACSGAVTANLLGTQISGDGTSLADSQLAQLSRLDSAPGAVVMTMGGNDIGFAPIVEKCVTPNSSCVSSQSFVDDVLARPGQLQASLLRAYEATWTTLNQPRLRDARGGGYAPVIVLAYPEVVRSQPLAACPLNVLGPTGGFDVEEVKFANKLVTNLNAAVERAVAAARAEGFEIYFVSETQSAFLLDHTVCAANDQAWVNAVVLSGTAPKSESMHPSAAGYLAETEAIVGWSVAVKREAPTDRAKATATGSSALVNFLNFGVDPGTPVALDTSRRTTNVVHPGQPMTIAASGLGSYPVTVSLHSNIEVLTTVEPNADGMLSAQVMLPTDVQLGAHDVIVQGWDDNGDPVTLVAHIVATPPTPLWVLLVGAAGLLLALGALVLTIVWRRRTATALTQPEIARVAADV